MCGGPGEGIAIFHAFRRHEAAVGEVKSVAHNAPDAVEPLPDSVFGVREMRGSQLGPGAVRRFKPLRAELRETPFIAVRAVEIFIERVQAAQITAVFGSAERSDQAPLLAVGKVKIAAVDRAGAIGGRRHEKLIGEAGLPGVDQVAVPAGAFMAEAVGVDARPFSKKLDFVVLGDLAAIHRLIPGVPDGKDDAPLGRAVDLNAEVAPVQSRRP